MARDLSRAKAILIGNATFQHPKIENLSAAAGCVAAMTELLTGDLCGWPAGRIIPLENVATPDALARRVVAEVRAAQDVLLVYYAGHGYRTRNGQLALALGETDPDPETLHHTAMLYENLADILRGCRAATKLVILDCCHAELGGKANYVFLGTDLAETYPVDGLYFIGASKRDQKAKSPRDGQLTYFTQALVDVVRAGIPGLPDELRLDQVFLEVRAQLVKARLPEPVDSGIRGARQYPFTRNAARPAIIPQTSEIPASAVAGPTPNPVTPTNPQAIELRQRRLRQQCFYILISCIVCFIPSLIEFNFAAPHSGLRLAMGWLIGVSSVGAVFFLLYFLIARHVYAGLARSGYHD
jgi:Caspase domain